MAAPKVLLPVGETELQATSGRLLHIAKSLALEGISVDVMTYSESVAEFSNGLFKEMKEVRTVRIESEPTHYHHITSLVNTFIKLTYDIYLPETDLKFYKLTAFDDFRGHIANFTYPETDFSTYDAVIFPIPSNEIPPLPDADIFYSTICFYAKENKIPLIGIQLYPVVQTPPIYYCAMDYIILKHDWEKEMLKEFAFDLNKAFVVTYGHEGYFFSTIEDKYLDSLLNPGLHIPKQELSIMLINHPRLRFCVSEALDVLNELDIPKTVFFLKRKFVIRELTEDDVINSYFMPKIKKLKGRVFLMEPDSKGSLLMLSDVIISPAYLTTLGFAAGYGKLAIVYNPLVDKKLADPNAVFIENKELLKSAILKYYAQKKALTSIPDIVRTVINDKAAAGF
ncbi:MAG: hypothetical protein HQK88_04705 [Nitrospirae bacterium]|nr:hypothetical protein [Nitrospirota bacterium]MBF0533370.1 hypothetical protein [Nitrospirota bacterium]MBF0616104.1 hypothetical protein [Nitrospirota bacterium]